MPRVALEALALGKIPQFKRAANKRSSFAPFQARAPVQRRGQNVLSVRRELDKGYGRIIVVDERLHALASSRVPDSHQTIVGRGDEESAIAIKVHCGDWV